MPTPDPGHLLRGARQGVTGARTRLLNGLRHLGEVTPEDMASTPRHQVWTRDKAVLYRYDAGAGGARRPILLVMSLVTRSYVFDLRPGSSLVEDLLDAGYDVFVLDWGVPDGSDALNDLSTYCDEYIPRTVEAVCAVADADRTDLLGYCFGGDLAMLSIAGNPDLPVRSMILLASPLDLHQMRPLRTMLGEGRIEPEHMLDDTGNVPPDKVEEIFSMMQPTAALTTLASMWTSLSSDEATKAHQALIGWSHDHVPFPGAAFREVVELLLRQRRLAIGRVPVGGRVVDLGSIRCPVLNVVGDRDTLVPPEANAPIEEALAGVDLTTITLPAGHAGLFVGRSARRKCVPAIVAWLVEQA